MNPCGPEIVAWLLAAGALLPGLLANGDVADADEPERGASQDEAFFLASLLWA